MEARDYIADLRRWGLTQDQISERSGIPQPTISKIARGEVDDVLSRKYRRLQAVHADEKARHNESLSAPACAPFAELPTAVQRAITGGDC